jgi:phytoene synthase
MALTSDDAVAAAYRVCEQITRDAARNFSWGIRLLPAAKRGALSAVYAVARRIDDIGDGSLAPEDKRRLLAVARREATAPADHPGDPVLVALADAARRFPIPLDAFGELVDGCEMDVSGRQYKTLDELVEYCRCVAGSIGRLSLGVFDPATVDAQALEQADALGVALQLTNILRDIREDHATGRIYLPIDDRELFGCEIVSTADGRLDPQDGALAELIRFEAARAWGWYDRGLPLLDVLDRRSAACCAAMAGIYGDLLRRIAADPSAVMRERVSLPTGAKLRVAATALSGRRRRG